MDFNSMIWGFPITQHTPMSALSDPRWALSPGPCPVPFPQNPCESLRGHPAGMTYAANILPHHPARGTFEDFTC